MRHLKTTLAVLGAATILVLAGNTVALATTGHSFILGKSNSANKVTALTRTTAGPALKLTTKSASNPPLVTNGKGKVANLNADALDGKDSSAFAPATVSSKLPIAYGYIVGGAGGTNPTVQTGSVGISSVAWNAGNSRYELVLTGQSYVYNNYATVITGSCGNLTPKTDSAGGKLLVIFDTTSACAVGGFAVVSYKLN